jgi:hypothetical protein
VHTISFYSYKGGVGRTLVVANVAKFLARFGQRVFAVDFDLEAPGLHYKFASPDGQFVPRPTIGMVDYIYSFAVEQKSPGSIREHAVRIDTTTAKGEGEIWLLPAGEVPSADYWKRLARINWHDLFYCPGAVGIPFFLEFKQRIQNEFSPDFLLIDSRTGITEIGGIATSVLPDKVVCLLMNNLENLEGTREVMRSIKRAPRLPSEKPIQVVPVLTRIPEGYEDVERGILADLKSFLNEEARDLASTLAIDDILILHSEPQLELSESLLVGGETSAEEPLLLRDYLRLFTKLVPRDVIDPYIAPLVREAMDRAFDDPARAQADLETLTNTYPHREAFRALLKFYRLRRASNKEIIHTAARFWEVTGETDDPLLLEIVKDHFLKLQTPEEDPEALRFVEDIWRRSGGSDTEILRKLAVAYEDGDNELKAVAAIEDFLGRAAPTIQLAVVYLRLLTAVERFQEGLDFINRFKSEFAGDEAFFSAWADVLLGRNDLLGVEELLTQDAPGLQELKTNRPTVYARLLQLARKTSELDSFLTQSLMSVVRAGPSAELQRIGELFDRFGRWEEFELRVRQTMSEKAATDFLVDVRRSRRTVGVRRR